MTRRQVETEFVFDRHAATDVSAAHEILVPQRRARIGRAQEGRPPRDERGDLRPGVLGPAEEERDDRIPDRGSARTRHRIPIRERTSDGTPSTGNTDQEGEHCQLRWGRTHPALRQLANRLVGILHGCLNTHTTYDEATAWSAHVEKAAAA